MVPSTTNDVTGNAWLSFTLMTHNGNPEDERLFLKIVHAPPIVLIHAVLRLLPSVCTWASVRGPK
jgi:hypothetical protein